MKNITVEEEYKKNPEISQKDVKEILDWVETQPHLPKMNEFQAIQSLQSCYFDKEKSKQAIECFYTYRNEFKDIFTDMDINSKELVRAYNTNSLGVLPGTTPEGYRVILWKWNDTDPNNFNFTEAVKLYVLFLTTVIYEEGSCHGYICLLDFIDSRWGHFMGLNLTSMRHGLKFVQDALPIRLKFVEHVHFPINRPLAIARPFIRTELYNMLKYRKHINEVVENIPIEMLPSDYSGGQGPSCKELREKWWNLINERRDQFLEEEKTMRSDESQRIQTKRGWFGLF